jgi:hypothetical protein
MQRPVNRVGDGLLPGHGEVQPVVSGVVAAETAVRRCQDRMDVNDEDPCLLTQSRQTGVDRRVVPSPGNIHQIVGRDRQQDHADALTLGLLDDAADVVYDDRIRHSIPDIVGATENEEHVRVQIQNVAIQPIEHVAGRVAWDTGIANEGHVRIKGRQPRRPRTRGQWLYAARLKGPGRDRVAEDDEPAR